MTPSYTTSGLTTELEEGSGFNLCLQQSAYMLTIRRLFENVKDFNQKQVEMLMLTKVKQDQESFCTHHAEGLWLIFLTANII